MAIDARNPKVDRLIHHSDRGAQYASLEYAGRRTVRGIALSKSRVANLYDNAKAESIMTTLKTKEVNSKAYATLDHARRRSAASSRPSTTPSASTRHSGISRGRVRSRTRPFHQPHKLCDERRVTQLTCLNTGVHSSCCF